MLDAITSFFHSRPAGPLVVAALAALVLATLRPARAAAQQSPDPMGGLVVEALRANLGLAADRLTTRRAAADVRAARGLFLPSLTLASRYSRLHGVPNIGDLVNPAYAALNRLIGANRFPTNLDITLPQRHDSHLELRQPLFNLGIAANYAAVRGREDGRRLAVRAAARQLAADVQNAYLAEASARRAVEIYAASLALARENERVAERLVAAGRATPEAVFRARADRSQLEQQLAEARQQRDARARTLNQILDRPLETPIETIPDSALVLPLRIGEDSAVAYALTHREELREVDTGLRTAQAGVRAATSAFLPNVSLAVDYGFQGNDVSFRSSERYWAASLVVSWNVFNGGQDAARRSAAKLDVDRKRLVRKDLRQRIVLDVRTAYDAAVVARDAIATADARLDAAQHTFELVRRRYEEGIASPVELADARTQLTSAQLNRVVTAYRYAMRYVDLERAAALRDLPR